MHPLLYYAIVNTANQNTGKPLYIRRYHIQSFHCALRSYSYRNCVSGDISSLFQVLFKPRQSQIFPSGYVEMKVSQKVEKLATPTA